MKTINNILNMAVFVRPKAMLSLSLIVLALTGCQSNSTLNSKVSQLVYFSHIGYMKGVPYGINQLSNTEYKARNLSYKFETQGGKLVAYSRVNSYGKPQGDRYNNNSAEWRLAYDMNGTLKSITSYDTNKRVVNTQIYTYHDEKETVLIQLVKPTGKKPTRYMSPLYREGQRYDHVTNQSVAYIHLTFNEKDLIAEVRFLTSDLEEAVDRDGTVLKKFSYDKFNNLTRERYISKKQTTPSSNDLREIHYRYDPNRNVVSVVYYIYEAVLTLPIPPYAQVSYEYDDVGNIIKSAFYNSDAKPAKNNDGCIEVATQYDERGNPVEVDCLNMTGFQTYKVLGFHNSISIREFNNIGQITKASNYDANRNPVLIDDGFFSITHQYNQKGQRTLTTYFGKDNKPIIQRNGSASLLRTYNEKGYIAEYAFLGPKGEPTIYDQSFSKERRIYDKHGNVIRFEYYGVDGDPTLTKGGYAVITRQYDNSGNHVESILLGLNGEAVTHKQGGYSKIVVKFNKLNQLIEKTSYGLNNQPVRHWSGYTTSYLDN